MVTLTGNPELEVMVIAFEVAGLLQMQAALEVSKQVITSPATGV